jgi:PadR family transcriptional regulator, regulatory protein AphA
VTELSKPAYVVLGMIATGRRSGYAMSRTAKEATRHFWAASDGQIYPQLKKLSDDGYIEGEREETEGGRERVVYSLTKKGREALDEWLNSGARAHYELRDEGLLRLFFAEELSVDQLRGQIEAMRVRHQRALEHLQDLEPRAGDLACAHLTLRYGLDLHAFSIDWYERLDAALADRPPGERAGDALRAINAVSAA